MVNIFIYKIFLLLIFLPLVIDQCNIEQEYYDQTLNFKDELKLIFKDKINSLKIDNENLKKIIENQTNKIKDIMLENTEIQTQIESFKEKNLLLKNLVIKRENEISKINTDISIQNFSSFVDNIKMDVNTIDQNINTLKTNLESIKIDITSLNNNNIYTVKLFNNEYYAYPDGKLAIDCFEYKYRVKNAPSGVYKISSISQNVYCDQSNDEGGWTILIKVRSGDNLDFNKNWDIYKNFFGDLKNSYWLGLENMNKLTNNGNNEMIVDYIFNNNFYQKKFNYVNIGSESEQYIINLVPTDNYMDKMKFTTKDKKNDLHSSNCAIEFNAGWWHNKCYKWRLTGDMNNNLFGQGVCFGELDYYKSISYGVMKIRRKDTF